VILSGGANRGAFQVGVIDSLASAGIRPDLLVGTSVGAFNAAFWAFHPGAEAGKALQEVWARVDGRTIRGGSSIGALSRLLRHGYLFDSAVLEHLVREIVPADARVETAPIPLRVVVTAATSGRRESICEGPLPDVLMASSAVPGLYSARELGPGRLYFDGGLVANCDFESAIEVGIKDVVAIDLLGDGFNTQPEDLTDTLVRSVTFSIARQTALAYRLHRSQMRIALIRLRLTQPLKVDDLSRKAELIQLGRAAGEVVVRENLRGSGRVVSGELTFTLPAFAERNAAEAAVPAAVPA
jgi:NTE family protein